MARGWIAALALAIVWLGVAVGYAQDAGDGIGAAPVRVVTVTRPPFSLVEEGEETEEGIAPKFADNAPAQQALFQRSDKNRA